MINENTANKGIFLKENVSNYKHENQAQSDFECPSVLLSQPDKITSLCTEAIKNGNETILMQNSNDYGGVIFGIILNPQKKLSCQTVLDIVSLADRNIELRNELYKPENNSRPYKSFYTRYTTNLTIDILENIEDDYSAPITSFIQITRSVPLAFLSLSKNRTELWLMTSDLYALKSATKLFRQNNKSVKEFFFQKVNHADMFNKMLLLEKTNLPDDDAHRVIFEK